MQYMITFLEGLISFVSPCLLPMIPIYLSYFAGGEEERSSKKTLVNVLGFISGFTIVFLLLGLFAGSLGRFFLAHQTGLNIVCGLVIVFFGLVYLGVFRIRLFTSGLESKVNISERFGFFSALLFGAVFSISWTPCVGAFLGSALTMASQQGSALKGALMLLCYSAGLGIPFFISALLLDQLKSAFDFIKKHYKVINAVSGSFLILVGIMMMTGTLGYLLRALA